MIFNFFNKKQVLPNPAVCYCFVSKRKTRTKFRIFGMHYCLIRYIIILSECDCTCREIAVTSAGKGWISNTFKLCEPLQSNEQVERFLDWISQIYGNVAMINYPYPTDFLNPVPGYPVREVCERLLDTSLRDKALVDAVFNAISVYTNYTGQTKCNALNSTSGKMDENAWDFQVLFFVITYIYFFHFMFGKAKWET